MKKSSHFDIAKAVISLFIILIGFAVFILFYTNSESILEDGGFYQFMTLTVIGFALLLGLLYLVNNSKPAARLQKAPVKKKHKKIRRK